MLPADGLTQPPRRTSAPKVPAPERRTSKNVKMPKGGEIGESKVVSTHLWNTPLNVYQRERDSFHSELGGLPGVCSLGVL